MMMGLCFFLHLIPLLFIFSFPPALLTAEAFTGTYGINYGRIANNIPSPDKVVTLLRAAKIKNVRIYDADHSVLKAFSGTGLEIVISIPNENLKDMSANEDHAMNWVKQNVLPFLPETFIRGIAIGNEVLGGNDFELWTVLLGAAKNVYNAVKKLNLDGVIQITTAHSQAVFSNSFPPSSCKFRDNVAQYMKPLLQFFSQIGSPFCLNAYPFLAYMSDPGNIDINYALFLSTKGIYDPKTHLHYDNMLDAQIDAAYAALEDAGYKDMEVIVTETGWASHGDDNEEAATIDNARTYNYNLRKRLAKKKGTPLRPKNVVKAYIFASACTHPHFSSLFSHRLSFRATMGGDTLPLFTPSIPHDEDSSLEHDQSQISTQLPTLLRGNNNFSMQTKDDQLDVDNELAIGDFDEIESQYSSSALNVEIYRRRMNSVHREILESYDQLRVRSEKLDQAKRKILSYSPGAWIEQVGGMKLSDYDIPQTTSLILIGPKGSGKSSLINRISKVFEEDHFSPERAQVSCNSSGEDGTFFLHEYMILRKSNSFCLYDTRGLSDDPSDNIEMLKQWMSKGVRHGELITRKSDASSLINRMRCKARQNFPRSRVIRMINFVIFVVDGLSVLQSIDGDDKQKDYDRVIKTAFNCPYLSYGDDKPVVVLTHGDLLSFADRVRVRGHLGNLLGIPSAKQIFDIPDRYDPVTELTITDMLHYCLEHADNNLPPKGSTVIKGHMSSVSAADIYFLAIMVIVVISACLYQMYIHHRLEQQEPKNALEIVWHEIRHLWLE